MRYFLGLALVILFSPLAAFADTQNPPGFEADVSKPVSQVQAAPAQTDNNPVTKECKSAWDRYKQPICACIQGDTILPTANNKILNFLFNNVSDTNATMSISGWKGGYCVVKFSEGTLEKTCQFKPATLQGLMNQFLNPSQFDVNSKLAQNLTAECQNTPA